MLCDDRKELLGHKRLQAQVAQSSPASDTHMHCKLQHWERRRAGRVGSLHQQRHSMRRILASHVSPMEVWSAVQWRSLQTKHQ